MKCTNCGIVYTGIEGMQMNYECCHPESIKGGDKNEIHQNIKRYWMV